MTLRTDVNRLKANVAEASEDRPPQTEAEFYQARFREEGLCQRAMLTGHSTADFPPELVAEVTRFLEAIALDRAYERCELPFDDSVRRRVREGGDPEFTSVWELYRRSYRLANRGDVVLSIEQLVEVQIRRRLPEQWVRRTDETCPADARAITEALADMLRAHEVPQAHFEVFIVGLVHVFGKHAAHVTWADICSLSEAADLQVAVDMIGRRLGLVPVGYVPDGAGGCSK